jgi:acyl dehydratase
MTLEPGARFATTGRTITEADVAGFAALTGDRHPAHTDAEWAASGPFGERIAHGMLVLSYAVGLVPFDHERVLALRGVRDVVFKRPVKIGDTVHVEGEMEELRPLHDGTGLVTCNWRILNQRGRLVARASVDVLWRPATTPSESAVEPLLI